MNTFLRHPSNSNIYGNMTNMSKSHRHHRDANNYHHKSSSSSRHRSKSRDRRR